MSVRRAGTGLRSARPCRQRRRLARRHRTRCVAQQAETAQGQAWPGGETTPPRTCLDHHPGRGLGDAVLGLGQLGVGRFGIDGRRLARGGRHRLANQHAHAPCCGSGCRGGVSGLGVGVGCSADDGDTAAEVEHVHRVQVGLREPRGVGPVAPQEIRGRRRHGRRRRRRRRRRLWRRRLDAVLVVHERAAVPALGMRWWAGGGRRRRPWRRRWRQGRSR
mmetsp:Transcript_703/g.2098  ORF Transcript_703/g.2098 Transcript_703/m.2098 type:complete len:219 (+) Transcript_703:987-1643(+)